MVGVEDPLLAEESTRTGYPVPEWQEVGPSLRVTIFPHPEAREQLVDVPVNERQAWFMSQLQNGHNCKASDLAAQWQVTEKTAKRDIADLKNKGLVEFVGAMKTGGMCWRGNQRSRSHNSTRPTHDPAARNPKPITPISQARPQNAPKMIGKIT